MKLKKRHFFLIGLSVGMAIILAPLIYDRFVKGRPPKTTALTPNVFVTAQIEQPQVRTLKQAGYKTLIDFRPDDEVAEQTSSAAIQREAHQDSLEFFYLPIPHGDAVPEAAVVKLSEILSHAPPPFLLYCRSGRRATRAWSLAEASRASGESAEEIYAAARKAGYSVDDLKASIQVRVSQRGKPKGGSKSGTTAKK